MKSWKITRRDGVCAACERSFDDGESIVSSLSVGPEGLERAEHCVHWWEGRAEGCATQECSGACTARVAELASKAEASEAGLQPESAGGDTSELFWWYGKNRTDRKRTVQLDLGSLERLFLELEGRTEQGLRELRYVLCLLLMRKRLLKVEKLLRNEEGEAFVVRRPRRDERYTVYVFDFSEERMAEMRTELQAIFDGAEAEGGITLPDPVEVTCAGEAGDDSESSGVEEGDSGSTPEEDSPCPSDEPSSAGSAALDA